MRVLIDTNVLISAALSANGTPYHFPYDIVNNNMHDVLKLYQSKGHSLSQDDYGSVSAGVTEENFATYDINEVINYDNEKFYREMEREFAEDYKKMNFTTGITSSTGAYLYNMYYK